MPRTPNLSKICPDDCFSGFQPGGPKFIKKKVLNKTISGQLLNFSDKVLTNLGAPDEKQSPGQILDKFRSSGHFYGGVQTGFWANRACACVTRAILVLLRSGGANPLFSWTECTFVIFAIFVKTPCFLNEGQITHLICARLKYDLFDFFRGCFWAYSTRKRTGSRPKTPPKKVI